MAEEIIETVANLILDKLGLGRLPTGALTYTPKPVATSPAFPTFRFTVDIGEKRQAVFTECELPSIELELEEIKEGGLNSFTHQLPGRRKTSKITLKNGVGKSDLLEWYFQVMNGKFAKSMVTIKLLDEQQNPVMVWEVKDAFPYKWSGPQLKTNENTIAIQTLELACGEVTISYKGNR